MEENNIVVCKRDEFINLLAGALRFNALWENGVDNWQGYGQNFDEFAEGIVAGMDKSIFQLMDGSLTTYKEIFSDEDLSFEDLAELILCNSNDYLLTSWNKIQSRRNQYEET